MNTMMLSLDLMWKGMVSIFVVTGVIFVVTLIITKSKRRSENK